MNVGKRAKVRYLGSLRFTGDQLDPTLLESGQNISLAMSQNWPAADWISFQVRTNGFRNSVSNQLNTIAQEHHLALDHRLQNCLNISLS